MLKRLKGQGGFTLIELLIVIVIMGILVVIVVGLVGRSAQMKARDAQRKADIREIQTALEQYFTDNSQYPAALSDLTGGTPPYLTAVPTDPSSGAGYTYTPTGTPPITYTLSATLENQNDKGPGVSAGVFTVVNKQ